MSDTLLSLVGVGKSFKEVNALTHVDLEIKSGQVIGLVGGNGAGKKNYPAEIDVWRHGAQ